MSADTIIVEDQKQAQKDRRPDTEDVPSAKRNKSNDYTNEDTVELCTVCDAILTQRDIDSGWAAEDPNLCIPCYCKKVAQEVGYLILDITERVEVYKDLPAARQADFQHGTFVKNGLKQLPSPTLDQQIEAAGQW